MEIEINIFETISKYALFVCSVMYTYSPVFLLQQSSATSQ